MTDFANLAIQIDASQTKAAAAELDKLTTAGARTEAATQALASAQAQAKTVIDAYKAALKEGTITQEQYNLGALNTKQGLLALEAEYRAATSAMTKMSLASQGVHASAGAQRAAMQQLSYQIGDVAQGFALGVNPMVIFAQQGGQVVQALSLMQGEAKGVLGFMAGPWGAAIMGATMILGPFIGKLFETSDNLDDVANAADNAASSLQRFIKQVINASPATTAGTDLLKAKLYAQSDVAKARLALQNAKDLQGAMYGDPELASAQNTVIAQLTSKLTTAEKKLSKAVSDMDQFQSVMDIKNKQEAAAAASSRTVNTSTAGHQARAAAISDEQRAYDMAVKSSQTYLASLEAENNKFGKTAIEIKQMEIDANAAIAPTRELQSAILQAGRLRIQEMTDTDAIANAIRRVKDQQDAYTDAIKKSKSAQDTLSEAIIKAAKAQDQAFVSLGQSISRLGGIGGTLGGIIGALGGDAGGLSPAWQNILGTAIGGKVDVLDTKGVKIGDRDRTLLDGITNIFKKDGVYQQTMTDILQGAGSGIAIGTAIFGSGNKGAQIGGAIGGAIGNAVGTAIGGPVGGAIGNAIVGTIGSLIGGLVSGPKRGSVSFTGAGNTTVNGKTGDLVGASNSAGGAVQLALGNIADQLGGSVGSYGFTIGMRNDEYRVSGAAGADVVGKNPGSVLYRGKDAQEAAKAALLNAIQDGAIQGIRQGAQNILKAGGDINTAVNKALKFNSVFDDLKQATDPMAYALDTITKKFDGLRKIFDEAGATASDYADLERLLGIERQKSIDSARQAVVDNLRDPVTMQIKILDLLGQSEEALAGSRYMELAGMKATLQPLQEMIYQLSDAQDIINKFSPLAAGLRAFRTELLGNGGDQSYGFLAAQFRATASAAAMGDATAMGNLRGTATSFLDAAKANATSGLEYRRAVGEVLAGVDKGIFAADAQVEYAQLQIDAIKNTNNILADMKAELATLQSQVVVNTNATLKLWKNVIPNGDAIQVEIAT